VADKLDYHQSVNYSQADPMKVLAQKEGLATLGNMPFGFSELDGTRGESAYVFKMQQQWGAFVQEGLGTKSLIAQDVYETTGKTFFKSIAQDTVACIINDLISVGATPVVLNAYWSSSSYQWLADKALAEDFIKGWRAACDKARVVWGGGETQALSGVIAKGALELAGSAFGVIKKEEHLVRGQNLKPGDIIVLIEASGVHSNGISLIRQVAEKLEKGYQTEIDESGTTLGSAALVPTHIYTELVLSLQQAGIDIHYLSNITGHGWRKLMRAERDFSYIMHDVPPPQPIFEFIAKQSNNNQQEMYGNYNMGAGYAVYVPADEASSVIKLAKDCGLKAWAAGEVTSGPKRVVIEPLSITFGSDSLEVR
jgi:phosphoribosylformylglycinamidine cyclo-ligase